MALQKNSRRIIQKIPGTNTVYVGGERLEYKSSPMYVVHNRKPKRYAMLLDHGVNAHIYVKPIRKNGEVSQTNPFWTRTDNWSYVGTIQYCVALRPTQPPEGSVAKFLHKILVGNGPTEVCRWVEGIEFWPKEKHVLVDLRWMLMNRGH